MEKFKVSFEANNQQLKSLGTKHASDTYADIEATFVLGEKWTDMDSVSAVWWNDFTRIATVLDSQGKCIVPHEVLARKGCVRVNLVGSIVEGDELITRLTSYSAEAVQVNEKIKLTGSETSEITPSQFEQFVAAVIAEVEKVTGMTAVAETLPAGSPATARYEDGKLYIGIPQGIQGETGNGIESVVFDNYTLRFAFTDGTVFTTPSIRGAEGNGIRSIAKTGTSGLVDTYTITFDDGSTTTYTVTNGAKGDKGDTGATPNLAIGTVETLEPTESATATITGTAENPVLNLGIPQGRTGEVTYEDLESILPRDTASGQIASFPDGQAVIPLRSLKVSLEPIQSGTGTPSPDNIRPISGHTEVDTHRTGKNLWGGLTMANDMHDAVNNESVCAFGSDSDGGYITLKASTPVGNAIFVSSGFKENTQYTLILNGKKDNSNPASNMIFLYTDNSMGYINFPQAVANIKQTCVAVSAQGKTLKTVKGSWSSGESFFYYDECGLFEGALDATSYEPYNGDTYHTDLGQTVYGGTLDVVSGELVVDSAYAQLDTETTYRAGGQARQNGYWVVSVTNIPNISGNIKSESSVVSSTAPKDMIYSRATISGFCKNIGSPYPIFALMDSDSGLDGSATLAQIQEAMNVLIYANPPQLVYELATPQTIQLTPQEVRTLLGTNNVWSDGDVVVVYSADTALWIEKKLNA